MLVYVIIKTLDYSALSFLLSADLDLWNDYFIFKVGAVGLSFIRSDNLNGVAEPHIEISRILAEHGLFGLVFMVTLIIVGIKIYKTYSKDINRANIASLFFIGIASTMHSSMRAFVTPIFIGLSTVTILKDENWNI